MDAPTPTSLDFETRSKAKLKGPKRVGSRRYAEHPSTEVVCAVLREPSGEEVCFAPHLHVERCNLELDNGRKLPCYRKWAPPVLDCVMAHNGIGFDRHIWRRLGWPEPREWVDTSYLARVAGMPQASLEWLSAHLLGRPKDLEGSKLTLKLSAVSRARKTLGQLCAITPEILCRVIEYCWLDVDLMAELWRDWLCEWYGVDLPGYEAVQLAMNDRGICFDVELAKTLLEADDILATRACKAAGVERHVVTSNDQLKAEFARRGCEVPNCQAETFELMLSAEWVTKWQNEPVSADVKALILARQACASIAAGKLRAGLLRVSPDGRLRDNTRIMGAHTGRESGQGVQLHNLAKGPPLDLDATFKLFDRGQLKAVHLVE